ncbi:hypothetical protein GCM10023335_18560 [Streptomyces siamensis]|uniref:Uncharacterized protein n=1 Tax=Streptomyces siamensis TaxID=1274986 RepID=A0ABP9IMG5_9ACTN
MEICIAVADWARGPTTSGLGVPGGEGTGAKRRKRPRHAGPRDRRDPSYLRERKVSPSGATAGSIG